MRNVSVRAGALTPGAIPDSYWEATAPRLETPPPLEGQARTDVAVIGAGFTGLSTALHLAQRRVGVTVLDANAPGWGASGRNNGQVVAALKHEPHEIETAFGPEIAGRLITAIGEAPDLVFELIARYGMSCDAMRKGIITAANTAGDLDALRRRTEIWQARGAPLRVLDRAATRDAIGTDAFVGACLDPRGGTINPLAYTRGLAKAAMQEGAVLHSSSEVRRLEHSGGGWLLHTPAGTLHASRVVIATNAHTGSFWPGLRRNFVPIVTPQVVTRPLSDNLLRSILPGGQAMSDSRHLVVGVRMHPDGRLHLGGSTGSAWGERPALFRTLQAQARRIFPFLPDLDWEFRWSGTIAMTPDRYPRLYDLAPGVASALGYSGRGIGTATMLGRELARWAAGDEAISGLVLPVSRQRHLPYYNLRATLVDTSIGYHLLKERLRGARRDRI